MTFAQLIAKVGNTLIWGINSLINIIIHPLTFLFELLQFIAMFIVKFVDLLWLVIQIIGSIFMFLVSLGAGIIRTITLWLNPHFNQDINFPDASESGLSFVLEVISKTGLLTVIPNVVICLIWFGFAVKTFEMLAGARSGSKSRT